MKNAAPPVEFAVVYRNGLPYPAPAWLRHKIERCGRRAAVWRGRALSVSSRTDAEGQELLRSYLSHLRYVELLAKGARQTLAAMGEPAPPRSARHPDPPAPCHQASTPHEEAPHA